MTTHYYTTSAEDTATVTGLVITTNTRNWGDPDTDDPPAGQTWRSGNSTDRQYASGDRTRSNVSVSRIVDENYNDGVTTHYYTTSAEDTATVTGLVITTNTRKWVTEAAAYYYNTEQVTIAVTGDATLKKVGRYDDPPGGILTETGKDGSKLLDSSMTLTFTAPSSGAEQRITISDSTTGDYPEGIRASNQFNLYGLCSDTGTYPFDVRLQHLQRTRIVSTTRIKTPSIGSIVPLLLPQSMLRFTIQFRGVEASTWEAATRNSVSLMGH